MSVRKVILGIAILILVWIIVAPFLCTSGTIVNLDGQVGNIDHGDLWSKQNPLACAIYSIGDFLCHQQQSRTFMLNGNELPFCVRDVALLAGFVIGLFLVEFYHMTRNRSTDVYIICSFALIVFDWALQHICDSNVALTRLITGLLAGAAVAMFLCFVADGLRNPRT